MAKVTDVVAQLARPIVEEQGCSLWDVEYVREAGVWYLRLYIDKAGGVSINDCEAISRPVSDKLDEADPIEGSYTFEVSSAGADRALAARWRSSSTGPRTAKRTGWASSPPMTTEPSPSLPLPEKRFSTNRMWRSRACTFVFNSEKGD